jgi:hypothetical protein
MILTLVLSVMAAQPSHTDLGGEEFMSILKGLHSDILGFELVCEGEIRWADTADDLKKTQPEGHECRFQGSYAYRQKDGAAYLDMYSKPLGSDGTLLRGTYAQVNGKSSAIRRAIDQVRQPEVIRESRGGPGSFTFACSPERFIYLYFWRMLGYSTSAIEYSDEGWEKIDGSMTLRVKIDCTPNGDAARKLWFRFWVDMSRGGHVLRAECYQQGTVLRSLVHNVKLARMRLNSEKQIWFPIYAEHDSFLWGMGHRTKPVLHETYGVVQSSLVFNRALTDDRFTVKWKGPQAESTALKKSSLAFVSTSKMVPPQLRTDPASVEEYQKLKLAEADRQAKQLDASPPGKRSWTSDTFIQLLSAILGVAILIIAFFLRRRIT